MQHSEILLNGAMIVRFGSNSSSGSSRSSSGGGRGSNVRDISGGGAGMSDGDGCRSGRLSAARCVALLHGRWFDKRQIVADYLPDEMTDLPGRHPADGGGNSDDNCNGSPPNRYELPCHPSPQPASAHLCPPVSHYLIPTYIPLCLHPYFPTSLAPSLVPSVPFPNFLIV